jgi:D-aminopeptidase
VYHTIWQWILQRARDNSISDSDLGDNYGTPIVGETADWWLNDVHRSALEAKSVHEAFANAMTQTEVQEGQHGGGAGMTCHFFPGGTGTSSRIVTGEGKEFTVGVLCQTNYGHIPDLQIAGVPVGKLILREKGSPVHMKDEKAVGGKADEGSIVVILM